MLHVNPVVGHRPPPESRPQTGDRGAMSKTSLVLDEGHPEEPGCLLKEVALLVGILRTTQKGDRVRPIDGNFLFTEPLGCNPGLIADLLDLARHTLCGFLPADLFPAVAARRSVARCRQPIRRSVCREHGNALNAQRTAIHNVVEVPFHGDKFPFTHGCDHAASAGTEVAGRSKFFYICQFQLLRGRSQRGKIEESPEGESGAPPNGSLEPSSAIHAVLLLRLGLFFGLNRPRWMVLLVIVLVQSLAPPIALAS